MTRHFRFAAFLVAAAVAALGQSAEQSQARPGRRITSAVALAKQQGLSEITLPAIVGTPTGVNTLEMIADNYSVFIAEPVSSVVSATPDALSTWYTLKTDEVLLRQRSDSVGNDLTPPVPLESLGAQQFLMPLYGGAATIDGVLVHEELSPKISLQAGKKYLIVLHLQQGGRVAELGAQADGVFELSRDGASVKSLRTALAHSG